MKLYFIVPLIAAQFMVVTHLTSADKRKHTSYHTSHEHNVRNEDSIKRNDIMSLPLVPIDSPTRRIRRRHLTKSNDQFQQKVPVSEKGMGAHFVDLWVGTPPRRQTLAVDTGSGITFFPCSQCKECGSSQHMNKVFNESESSTFYDPKDCNDCMFGECDMEDIDSSKNICKVPMSFDDGFRWSAYEVKDFAYLGGATSKPVGGMNNVPLQDTLPSKGSDPAFAPASRLPLSFACQTKLSTSSSEQALDGIMGMDNSDASFFKQMYNSGMISEPSFSICFHGQPLSSNPSSDKMTTGALTFGGVDDRLHDTEMKYAQNTRSSGYYGLHLKKIYFRTKGGTSAYDNSPNSSIFVSVDYENKIFDGRDVMLISSTPETYMTKKIQNYFLDGWKELTGFDFEDISKMTFTVEELEKLPTILFQFEGIEDKSNKSELLKILDPAHPNDILVAMPPSHYLAYKNQKNNYVPSIMFSGKNEIILGSNFMQNHNILFDQKNKRIGFAESKCEYSSIVTTESLDSQEKNMSHAMGGQGSCDSFFCTIGILLGFFGAICIAIASWKVIGGYNVSVMDKTLSPKDQSQVSLLSRENDKDII